MKWVKPFFIQNAKLYAMVLESQWKNGEEHAKLLSDLFKEYGLKGCHVLDIPCGIGRISVPLAKLGCRVTGVDISPYFIKVAKRHAKQLGVAEKSSFVVGKMQDIGSLFPQGRFDAAINISTSTGYGSEKDDLKFFRNLRQVVKTGGPFVISLANRDYIFSHFVENVYEETDRLVILLENELDVAHSKERGRWRFYLKTGESLKLAAEGSFEVRFYSPHELVRMLRESGWKVAAIYDSLTYRRPYSPDTPGMTVVAVAT